MKFRPVALLLPVVFLAVAPRLGVEACGPDWEPEVFVSHTSPDDLATFAQGHLAILQAGYDSNEYAVAWRYLTGGRLSNDERNSYVPPPPGPPIVNDWRGLTPGQVEAAQEAQKQEQLKAQPAGRWQIARLKFAADAPSAGPAPSFPTDYSNNIVFDENYLNCPGPAFESALLTLNQREHAWGRVSSYLTDWIHAQDAVFSNCGDKPSAIPARAPDGSPALLKADRAYQIASATFYAKKFDDAAAQFQAISADASSPWSEWGAYLAARAIVRKAFAMGKATNPYSADLASYDAETMARAQKMLEALLARPNPMPSRAAIQHELNFIRIRTEPEKRAAEICAALTGPSVDPDFAQDLQDLSWVLVKQIKIQNPPPLLAWIAAWRGAGTAASSFALWQQDRALPWLVMAMVKAEPSDLFAPQLIDEAKKIAPGSPAYDTVFYHRVRLLTGLKRTDEARALLDAALPAVHGQKPDSRLNAFLGERMAVARSFTEFLVYAPRTVLTTGSAGAEDLQTFCNERAHATNSMAPCPELKQPFEFDVDAVEVLNRHTPQEELMQAATSPSLSSNLRQNLLIVAWTRSVLLEDDASAARLAPLLPEPIRQIAGNSTGFAADLAILRNPGIRPFLEDGVSRVASVSTFDSYHNNWWCKPWQNSTSYDQTQLKPQLPLFLADNRQPSADADYQKLIQLPDSAAVIGQRVVDYANSHPDDPQVPEALALTVRATHYACQNWETNSAATANSGSPATEYTPVSKAAFELLHRRYPKSSWALKTRYYY
ncbi:MAG TPA: hypothetical protein VGF96_18525 [Terracidiphilus sp.]